MGEGLLGIGFEWGGFGGGWGGNRGGKGREPDVRFLSRRHLRRQRPVRRSRPIACHLARLGLLIVSDRQRKQCIEDRILFIPSLRVRAVSKGMLNCVWERDQKWIEGEVDFEQEQLGHMGRVGRERMKEE